jgi:hypothetical protein
MLIGVSSFPQINVDSLFGKINPQKWAASIEKNAAKLEEKIIAKSAKTLDKLQKQEERIYKKMLHGKDSLQAKAALADTRNKYQALRDNIKNSAIVNGPQPYIAKLDSLTTSLKFLDQNGVGGKVKDALAKTESLQSRFQQAEEIRKFIRDRKQQLKQQLEQLSLVKQLRKINKELYYYSEQIKEYKELLHDSKKVERKALELLCKSKIYRDFMKSNSMLASLFPMPGTSAIQSGQQGFVALQSRAQVNAFLSQQGAANQTNVADLQGNIQDATSQIDQLRNKLGINGHWGDELEMPDFHPNSQKTKSFFKRLEYGTSIQSQKANGFFPSTTDIGLSVGYKLNDKSIVGLGVSYKIGLGKGWSKMKLSNEGMGLRSFIDWKIKGNFWITGGYEQNYRTLFNDFEPLRDLNAWQQSGLIGASKSVSLKSKLLKKTKVQLLWDFLSSKQKPKTSPILFRLGYTF